MGDVFLGVNGELSTLIGTLRLDVEGGIGIFNFTVEGNHNYFILAKEYEYGQSCVLVHNTSPVKPVPRENVSPLLERDVFGNTNPYHHDAVDARIAQARAHYAARAY